MPTRDFARPTRDFARPTRDFAISRKMCVGRPEKRAPPGRPGGLGLTFRQHVRLTKSKKFFFLEKIFSRKKIFFEKNIGGAAAAATPLFAVPTDDSTTTGATRERGQRRQGLRLQIRRSARAHEQAAVGSRSAGVPVEPVRALPHLRSGVLCAPHVPHVSARWAGHVARQSI